jgi:hypothetical protein
VSEQATQSQALGKAEVLRRVNVLREGNHMSRGQFGKLVEVRWRGDTLRIATTKHTIFISQECWEALGEQQV